MIADDELAACGRLETARDYTCRQLEFEHDRRVVAADVGMHAVRGKTKTHRRFRRGDRTDLPQSIDFEHADMIVEKR